MIDALTITLSGPTGSGKSLIGGIIAKVLHERGADVEVLLDGCPSADSGIDLSGFAVILRDAPEPTSGAFEVTGPPVSEMSAEIRGRLRFMGVPLANLKGVQIHHRSGLIEAHYRPLYRRDYETRHETAEEYAAWKAAESKAKPEADPMPPAGPLTSTINLKPGDIVRVSKGHGGLLTVSSISDCGRFLRVGSRVWGDAFRSFDFVARPGAWMPFTVSKNPAPGLDVRVKEASGIEFTPGPLIQWDNARRCRNRQIVAFMVVPKAAAGSTHGRVTIGDTDHVIDMPDPKSPASLKAFWDTVAAHYRSERANDTAITLTLSGPPGAGKTRFGEYMLRALSDYGSTLGKTQDAVERNIRRFRESEETGAPVCVGQFEGSSLFVRTQSSPEHPVVRLGQRVRIVSTDPNGVKFEATLEAVTRPAA